MLHLLYQISISVAYLLKEQFNDFSMTLSDLTRLRSSASALGGAVCVETKLIACYIKCCSVTGSTRENSDRPFIHLQTASMHYKRVTQRFIRRDETDKMLTVYFVFF